MGCTNNPPAFFAISTRNVAINITNQPHPHLNNHTHIVDYTHFLA